MQKWKIISVLSLYLLGALGVHVQFHFCCGQLAAIEWNPDQQSKCSDTEACCKKGNCCSSIVIQTAFEDEHLGSAETPTILDPAQLIAAASFILPLEISIPDQPVADILDYRGPPPRTGKSICCLLQNWKVDVI